MFLNVSRTNQSLRNLFGDYRLVIPNEIVSDYVFPDVKLALSTQFKKIKRINFSGVESILLKRGHSLGDVVMAFPIVNHLMKKGKKVSVHTNTKYAIPGVNFVIARPYIQPDEFDLTINLDLVVERDHYDEKYFGINRVDIYKEYLNLKNIGNDWAVDFLKVDIDTEDAIIAIQLKGSTAAKNMNIIPLLDELERRNIKFYVIDDLGEFRGSYKNVVEKPTDVVGLLNVFKKVKGVVTFDSGPLWLSHIVNTPAFVIVGPTCGKKLTVRHPNDRTTFYDTKLDYGCIRAPIGCGEGAKECGGKFSCLKNVNHNQLKEKFFEWIETL
jgi:hypothetical protein